MTETNNNNNDNWPLSSICEPHESNDVLLLKKVKTILAEFPSHSVAEKWERGGADEGKYDHEHDHPSTIYQGNRRFLELVRERQDDYRLKSPMEKPLVALDLLRQWRDQSPPGRFLVEESSSRGGSGKSGGAPPLWRDVGDKEARSRISKALKNLSSSTTSSDDTTVNNSTIQMPQQLVPTAIPIMKRLDSDAPLPRSIPQMIPQPLLSPPQPNNNFPREITTTTPAESPPQQPLSFKKIPKLVQPKRLISRRISAQVRAATAQGKLYGRFQEQERLAQILKDASTQDNKTTKTTKGSITSSTIRKMDFVSIKGPWGVGKTALARTLKNPMAYTENDDFQEVNIDNYQNNSSSSNNITPSFFIETKFEQLMNPNPYKVFVDGVNQFCHQLQNKEELLEDCREAISEAFQDDMDILLKLIPALKSIVCPEDCQNGDGDGPGNSLGEENGSSTSSGATLLAQKVNFYFCKMLQIMSSLIPQHPVIIVLDDIHWASEASMDILTTLLSDSSCHMSAEESSIIFVATLYDGEEPKPHYTRAMEKLSARKTIRFHEIQLNNLREIDVIDVVAETLDCPYDKVKGLSALLFSLTQGNPMFLATMLPKMQHKGFIYPDEMSGEWTYDLNNIKAQFGGAKNASDLIRMKFFAFSEEVQATLKYVSSLGSSRIDTSILELIVPESVPSHLDEVAEFGFLKKKPDDGSYFFPVDGIRNTIYNLVPEGQQRKALHLEIAKKLWQFLDQRHDKEFLFVLLNQLMLGDSILKQNSDRHAVAALCLRAGEIAAKTLGFQTAWVYLLHGISILPEDKLWGRDNYDLSLRLHNAAVEVCYCNAQFDQLDEMVQTILSHSRVFEDSLVARTTQIFALGSRQKLAEAVDSALGTLRELGDVLPSNPSLPMAACSYQKTKKMLHGMTDESIMKIQRMTDRKRLAAMQILNHMFLYAFYSRPYLAALVCHRMVQLTVEFGISEVSSVAFCFYAEFLVGGPSIEEGLRYGKLGMKLYEKFNNDAWLCRVWSSYFGAVIITKEPMSRSLDPLHHAFRTGLRTGDIEYAMLSGMMYVYNAIGSGTVQLPVLQRILERLAADMMLTGHTLALSMLLPVYRFTLNLIKGLDDEQRKEDVRRLVGQEIDPEQPNEAVRLWIKHTTIATAFLFEDYDLALEYSAGVHALYTKHGYNTVAATIVLFFECMTLLQKARRGCLTRLKTLVYVKRRLKLLRKWAYMAPANILDKYHILVAEMAWVAGKLEKASLNYRSGILHATSQGRHGMAALGKERLGKFFLERNDKDSALPLLQEACEHYKDWGAEAKAKILEQTLQGAMTSLHNKQP